MKDINKMSVKEREIVLARRAYKKAWREKNAEKVRAAQERFYLKQAAKITGDHDSYVPCDDQTGAKSE